MRSSETWVCVADGSRAQFYHCDGPSYLLEPVLGFGLPDSGRCFAGRLASQLDRAARTSLFRHLVLVGPAPVLQELEDTLDPGTRSRVVGEVPKNLSKATPRELETHLADVLAH